MWKICFKFKIFALFLFLNSFQCELKAASLSVSVEAEGAFLMNASTGAILYEKNASKLFYPASTTKIATAIYALETAGDQLSRKMSASKECIGAVSEEAKRRSNYTLPSYWLVHDACHMGIKAGEEFTLKDLLYGMMIPSADDAANMIAMSLGGTIPNFMDQLNAYLKKKGCVSTHLNNPHGLFHPEHVTTPKEMAFLTAHAMKNPLFRQIVATTRWVRPKTNKQGATVLAQSNKLLKKGKYFYPKAIGVKTGYVAKAGYNLVAAASDGERILILVLFKSSHRDQRFEDAIKLFEAAFNQPKVERLLLKAGESPYTFYPQGAAKAIKTSIANPVSIQFYPAEEPELKAELQWKKMEFPIEKDQVVGEIIIRKKNDHILEKIPLLANESVSASWGHWLKNLW